MATWELRRDDTGETRSLQGWGLRTCVRTCINQGTDQCELVRAVDSITEGERFRYGHTAAILRDGELWFWGRFANPARTGTGTTHSIAATLAGPWDWLARMPFVQAWRFVTSIDAQPTLPHPTKDEDGVEIVLTEAEQEDNLRAARRIGNWPTVVKKSSMVLLHEDDDQQRVPTDETIRLALQYAIAAGAPIQIGVIGEGVAVLREQVQDVTVADVITRSLRWTPDLGVWWDYTTTPPTIHVTRRKLKANRQLTCGVDGLSGIQLSPRHDLVLPGVTINYVRRNEHSQSGFIYYTMEQDQAGDTTDPDALVRTFELPGAASNVAGTMVAPEPAPAGVAARLLDALDQLQWQGQIDLIEDDCRAGSWLKHTIDLAGGRDEWADMHAVVQQSAEDVSRGTTVLTLGPAEHLGPADLVSLLRPGQQPDPVTTTRSGGGPNPSVPIASPQPEPEQRVQLGPPEEGGEDHPIGDLAEKADIYAGARGPVQYWGYFTAGPDIVITPEPTNPWAYPPLSFPANGTRTSGPPRPPALTHTTDLVPSGPFVVYEVWHAFFTHYTATYFYVQYSRSQRRIDLTLDLRSYVGSRLVLVGTSTKQTAGGSVETPVTIDITDYAGAVASVALPLPTPDTFVFESGGIIRGDQADESVSWSTLRVYPPEPLV
jgi:hypothetical protein